MEFLNKLLLGKDRLLLKLLAAAVLLAFVLPLVLPDVGLMAPFLLFGAALTAAKKIKKLDGPEFSRKCKVKGSVKLYHGALAAVDADGYIIPASTAADLVVGVINLQVQGSDDPGYTGQALGSTLPTTGNLIDTTGLADGARTVVVERGVFKFLNKAGDLVVDPTHVFRDVFVEDSQTVRATGAGTIKAGVCVAFDDDGLPFVGVGVNFPYGRV